MIPYDRQDISEADIQAGVNGMTVHFFVTRTAARSTKQEDADFYASSQAEISSITYFLFGPMSLLNYANLPSKVATI